MNEKAHVPPARWHQQRQFEQEADASLHAQRWLDWRACAAPQHVPQRDQVFVGVDVAAPSDAAATAAAPAPAAAAAAAATNDDTVTSIQREHGNFDELDEVSHLLVGHDCPTEALRSFAACDLGSIVLHNVTRRGMHTPLPIQRATMSCLLVGRDVLIVAPTGSGKTLAYALPMIRSLLVKARAPPKRHCDALIVCPTRELAAGVHSYLEDMCAGSPVSVVCVYGGAARGPQIRKLERGCDVVVATPGRLTELVTSGALHLGGCGFVVVDETDRMLDMGFGGTLEGLWARLPRPGHRQCAIASATLPPEVQGFASHWLEDFIWVQQPMQRVGPRVLEHAFVYVGGHAAASEFANGRKHDTLSSLVDGLASGRVLVYVRTRRRAEALLQWLQEAGYERVFALTGTNTSASLGDVADGDRVIFIASSLQCGGIYMIGVDHVVFYNVPMTVDTYLRLPLRCTIATWFVDDDAQEVTQVWPELIPVLRERGCRVPQWLLTLMKHHGVDYDRDEDAEWGCFDGAGGTHAGSSDW